MSIEITKETQRTLSVLLLTVIAFLTLSIQPVKSLHLILAKATIAASLVFIIAIAVQMTFNIRKEFLQEEEEIGIGPRSVGEFLLFVFAMVMSFCLIAVVSIVLTCVVASFPHYGWLDICGGTVGFAAVFHWRLCLYEPCYCQCENCLAERTGLMSK